MLLSSVASEKGDDGRVGLMALVLRAPVPTRGRRSLEHRYSQLFPTSLLGCGNTGWPASSYSTTLFYYSAVLEEIGPVMDRQDGQRKRKERERKNRVL